MESTYSRILTYVGNDPITDIIHLQELMYLRMAGDHQLFAYIR